MLKGMIRAATLLAGLATAMTTMTAAAQNTQEDHWCRQGRGS